MNIYDFDNTIIKGDSSYKFIGYSFLKHPLLVIWSILASFKEWLKSLFGKSNFGLIKSELFSFVKKIDNFDQYMEDFVLSKMKYIKKFYLENQKEDDLVISASFDFIIIPFCNHLGIKNVIATKYDVKEGHIIGYNCKGKEKVRRFKEKYADSVVNEAYSDSLSDIPMLMLAKKAYLVKDDKIEEFK
jgi:HAD superfamily phosphoserine phosphatase-like hydrolase